MDKEKRIVKKKAQRGDERTMDILESSSQNLYRLLE